MTKGTRPARDWGQSTDQTKCARLGSLEDAVGTDLRAPGFPAELEPE